MSGHIVMVTNRRSSDWRRAPGISAAAEEPRAGVPRRFGVS